MEAFERPSWTKASGDVRDSFTCSHSGPVTSIHPVIIEGLPLPPSVCARATTRECFFGRRRREEGPALLEKWNRVADERPTERRCKRRIWKIEADLSEKTTASTEIIVKENQVRPMKNAMAPCIPSAPITTSWSGSETGRSRRMTRTTRRSRLSRLQTTGTRMGPARVGSLARLWPLQKRFGMVAGAVAKGAGCGTKVIEPRTNIVSIFVFSLIMLSNLTISWDFLKIR